MCVCVCVRACVDSGGVVCVWKVVVQTSQLSQSYCEAHNFSPTLTVMSSFLTVCYHAEEVRVVQIEFDRKIMEKEKQKRMSQIENEIMAHSADADFYLMKQSESNQVCGGECGVWDM